MPAHEPPCVSVIIPAHNAGAVVETAIHSVAAQRMANVEVIFIDDASQDDTASRAQSALLRTGLLHKVVHLRPNHGPAAARNQGIVLAKGKYVAFLDADDEWLPGKLESQISLLEANPHVTLCGCQAVWVNEAGKIEGRLFRNLPELLPQGWKRLLSECFIATPCAVVRRQDLGIRPFDPRLVIGEDRDLWIKLATNGVVGLVQDVKVRIRLSPSSFMAERSHLIATYTRPMIEGHISAFSGALSWRDILAARGQLFSQMGKSLCQRPDRFWKGAAYLVAAAFVGYRPVNNLRHLAYSAPLIRPVKEFAKALLVSRN